MGFMAQDGGPRSAQKVGARWYGFRAGHWARMITLLALLQLGMVGHVAADPGPGEPWLPAPDDAASSAPQAAEPAADGVTRHTMEAINSGWYDDKGYHIFNNRNYLVGSVAGTERQFRNFFVFDLPALSGHVLTATLHIRNPMGSGTPKTYTLHDVGTPIAELVAGSTNRRQVFSDLGSGTAYGSVAVSQVQAGFISVSLNQAGLNALRQSLGGQLAFGGRYPVEINRDSFLFGTSERGPISLVIDMAPTPIPPKVSIGDTTLLEGSDGNHQAAVTASLSWPTTEPVTVTYTTANGTARAGEDYLATTRTVRFAANTVTRALPLTIVGDTIDELDETFIVRLSNPINAERGKMRANVTIDDDDGPTLAINDAIVLEGTGDKSYAHFTLELSTTSVQTVTARYTTVNGSAWISRDYTGRSGIVQFAPGLRERRISVAVRGDNEDETDETFRLVLSWPTDTTLVKADGTATIVDDDPTPPFEADTMAWEGHSSLRPIYFRVALTAYYTESVTVGIESVDDTAVAGVDFRGVRGKVVFQPGQFQKWVAVRVYGDTEAEPNKRFRVRLTPPDGIPIVKTEMIGVIVDDD
jgi:hypothetical protein